MEELKIGIIAEGITDYWVLKHIIERMLKDKDPNVISLQPKVINGKQDGFGGWGNVFTYIEKEEYIIDLAQTEEFDYIVVQIDTDVADQYGVDNSIAVDQLYEDVVKKILDSVHEKFDKSKLIFAICINSLECWLIPFVTTNQIDCKAIDNCVNKVNKHIKAKYGTIDKDQKGKAIEQYYSILSQKEAKKPAIIESYSKYNYGFAKFIDSLKGVAAKVSEDKV